MFVPSPSLVWHRSPLETPQEGLTLHLSVQVSRRLSGMLIKHQSEFIVAMKVCLLPVICVCSRIVVAPLYS